jgi:hypothetical protein
VMLDFADTRAPPTNRALDATIALTHVSDAMVVNGRGVRPRVFDSQMAWRESRPPECLATRASRRVYPVPKLALAAVSMWARALFDAGWACSRIRPSRHTAARSLGVVVGGRDDRRARPRDDALRPGFESGARRARVVDAVRERARARAARARDALAKLPSPRPRRRRRHGAHEERPRRRRADSRRRVGDGLHELRAHRPRGCASPRSLPSPLVLPSPSIDRSKNRHPRVDCIAL